MKNKPLYRSEWSKTVDYSWIFSVPASTSGRDNCDMIKGDESDVGNTDYELQTVTY